MRMLYLLQILPAMALMATVGIQPIGARAAQEPLPETCQELVLNGGFEEDGGWRLEVTNWPATILETDAALSGQRALATGLGPEDEHELSYSVAQQSVVLPGAIDQVTLTLGILPQAPATGNDRNYVLLQSPSGEIIAVALYSIVEGNDWQTLTRDLPALLDYAGQEIVLQIGVYNDGLDEKAQMLVDDVSLVVCGEGVAATTITPTEAATSTTTPTATAIPELPASATPTTPATATATPTRPEPTATASPPEPGVAPVTPTTRQPTVTPTATPVATAPGGPSPTTTPERPPSTPTPTAVALPAPPDRSAGLASIESAPILLGVTLSAVLVLAVLIISTQRPRR